MVAFFGLTLAQDTPPVTVSQEPAPGVPGTPGEAEAPIGQTIAPSTTPPTGTPVAPPSRGFDPTLLLIILMVGVFWFIMMGGQRKEKKKRAAMLAALAKGAKVQTIGGILGTVVEVRDNDVIVKVDENSNTRMRFAKSAIQTVLEDKED